MATGRMEHTGAAPSTTLASSMGAADTSFSVVSGSGYPTGAIGNFVIAVDPGLPSEEHILCSARVGVVFTVASSGRGYDNTSAAGHTAPTAVVEHIAGAFELDDYNSHIYVTSRDDHTQYARTDGTRAVTGTQSFVNLTASGTTAVQSLTSTGIAVTGNITATGLITPAADRARVYGNAGTVPTGFAVLKYASVSYDPQTSYSAATGLYTVPANGYYRVHAQFGSQNPGATGDIAIAIYYNGAVFSEYQADGNSGTSNVYASITDVLSAVTSDTIGIYAFASTGSLSYVNSAHDTYGLFERVG